MVGKIIKKIDQSHFNLKIKLEEISIGDIIEDSWGNKLVIDIKNNKLKTVRWFLDSLPSKIAEETYEMIRTDKGDILIYNNYSRPELGTEQYEKLIKQLNESGIVKK